MHAGAGPDPASRIGTTTRGVQTMTTFTDFHRSDFQAEHVGDILWRDHAGDDVLWLMNNNTPSTVAPLPAGTPDWHFKAAADFDVTGPGDSDILWQNDNGSLAIW